MHELDDVRLPLRIELLPFVRLSKQKRLHTQDRILDRSFGLFFVLYPSSFELHTDLFPLCVEAMQGPLMDPGDFRRSDHHLRHAGSDVTSLFTRFEGVHELAPVQRAFALDVQKIVQVERRFAGRAGTLFELFLQLDLLLQYKVLQLLVLRPEIFHGTGKTDVLRRANVPVPIAAFYTFEITRKAMVHPIGNTTSYGPSCFYYSDAFLNHNFILSKAPVRKKNIAISQTFFFHLDKIQKCLSY